MKVNIISLIPLEKEIENQAHSEYIHSRFRLHSIY